VITEKIAHLVERGLAPATKIAAITFTNKAAREMRERVAKRIKGDAAEGLSVCTFHALGLKFLQIEHARAGLRRGFSVLDADDSAGLVKELAGAAVKSDKLFQWRWMPRARLASWRPRNSTPRTRSGWPRSTRWISTT
jgi:ATP-dependent DNA helicase Rep